MPASKGIARKSIVGFVLALLVAVPLAFGADYVRRVRSVGQALATFVPPSNPLNPSQAASQPSSIDSGEAARTLGRGLRDELS